MKKFVALLLAAMMMLSLASFASAEEAPKFKVLSARSALSDDYQYKDVLNALQQEAGVQIEWETWSDSLGEVVGTRLSGNSTSSNRAAQPPDGC